MNNVWSDEERYRKYSEYSKEYVNKLEYQVANSIFKPVYHIYPHSGLLNDPNGFSYYKGKWRLFYQTFPYGPVHGLKSWGYIVSTDLIHWEYKGLALLPDTQYDCRGVYSGSGITYKEELILYFTGNAVDENGARLSCQMRAIIDDKGDIHKEQTPVITIPPKGYTMHFRDPQVFRYNDSYHMLIGAQRQNKQGTVLCYNSSNLRDWNYSGELKFTTYDMGYMVECPNLVFIDGRPVLIFCPQGLDKSIIDYQNIYPNMVLLGDEYSDNIIHSTNPIKNLDMGFEFYAAQAINAPDGRVLLIGWIGLPDVPTPTEKEGWAHCLSLVRELKICDNMLLQYPVKETEKLRRECKDFSAKHSSITPSHNCYELEVNIPADSKTTLRLAANSSNVGGLIICIDNKKGEITVDRSFVAGKYTPLYDIIRKVKIKFGINTCLNIFIDKSVFEIFINKGEEVITGRFFPEDDNRAIYAVDELNFYGSLWEINI